MPLTGGGSGRGVSHRDHSFIITYDLDIILFTLTFRFIYYVIIISRHSAFLTINCHKLSTRILVSSLPTVVFLRTGGGGGAWSVERGAWSVERTRSHLISPYKCERGEGRYRCGNSCSPWTCMPDNLRLRCSKKKSSEGNILTSFSARYGSLS